MYSTASATFGPALELFWLSLKCVKIEYFDCAIHYYPFVDQLQTRLSQSKKSTENEPEETSISCGSKLQKAYVFPMQKNFYTKIISPPPLKKGSILIQVYSQWKTVRKKYKRSCLGPITYYYKGFQTAEEAMQSDWYKSIKYCFECILAYLILNCFFLII